LGSLWAPAALIFYCAAALKTGLLTSNARGGRFEILAPRRQQGQRHPFGARLDCGDRRAVDHLLDSVRDAHCPCPLPQRGFPQQRRLHGRCVKCGRSSQRQRPLIGHQELREGRCLRRTGGGRCRRPRCRGRHSAGRCGALRGWHTGTERQPVAQTGSGPWHTGRALIQRGDARLFVPVTLG
jgi:hypothetical protein